MQNTIQHMFLVGAKSFGVCGGYETFINKLKEYHQNNEKIKYHVAVKANGSSCMDLYKTESIEIIDEHRFIYYNAECFRICVPEKLGPAQPICYDVVAPKEYCGTSKTQGGQHPIVYIMACRIGPFIKHYYKKIHKLGGRIFLNPDGACEIIGSTGENPVKSRLHEGSVFYPNSNTEYRKRKSYSGFLKRFCFMPELPRYIFRTFFSWDYLSQQIYNTGIVCRAHDRAICQSWKCEHFQ